MEDKRIAQAESYVKQCFADNRVRKKRSEQVVIRTYKQNVEESLSLAQDLIESDGSVLWAVVTSYYAMFYSAVLALGVCGYTISGQSKHKTVSEALIALMRHKIAQELIDDFEDVGIEALALIQQFEYERGKRSAIQYETTADIKRAQAKTSFSRATRFCTVMDAVIFSHE